MNCLDLENEKAAGESANDSGLPVKEVMKLKTTRAPTTPIRVFILFITFSSDLFQSPNQEIIFHRKYFLISNIIIYKL